MIMYGKNTRNNKVPVHDVERYSAPIVNQGGLIPFIRCSNIFIERSITVNGDAPKELVRIYHYSKDNTYNKRNISKWPLYIAKTGHKWYPVESITELLLNQLGSCFGLKMAESELAVIAGQVRFLSKYFLNKDESLVHGAEIFVGYMGDKDIVEQIEAEGLASSLFSLQFVAKSVNFVFPGHADTIMPMLVRLLLYDALVGNNDRHFYNWGVVQSVKNNVEPFFSPVYDTARGLFWNEDEELLKQRMKDKGYFSRYLKKYCDKSRPKLGWEGESTINHFKMVELIYNNEFYIKKDEVKFLFRSDVLETMLKHIDDNYSGLFTDLRMMIVKECLKYRFERIKEILT